MRVCVPNNVTRVTRPAKKKRRVRVVLLHTTNILTNIHTYILTNIHTYKHTYKHTKKGGRARAGVPAGGIWRRPLGGGGLLSCDHH